MSYCGPKRDVLRMELDRWQGDYTGNGSPAVHPTTTVDEPPLESLPLSYAIPLYLKHLEHRAPGTIEAKRNALRRFLDVVGNKPVHTIAKPDCIVYRDTLRKLPSNLSKRFPVKSIKEALVLVAQSSGGKPTIGLLSKNTINQDLLPIGHFFGWLVDEGKRLASAGNPVEGLAYESIEKQAHETFSDLDISTIFDSAAYTRQLKEKEYARYFLPLILLYSGCRRKETANLAVRITIACRLGRVLSCCRSIAERLQPTSQDRALSGKPLRPDLGSSESDVAVMVRSMGRVQFAGPFAGNFLRFVCGHCGSVHLKSTS